MKRGRRKGGSKDKVFGCDLVEHLSATSQEIPHVLRSCSEFIEEYGIVDGIYRLSGVSSNTQKLRSEFDAEGNPDLYKDLYLQDIHCVSSLCKAYFRELPNPLLTYQLYDHFADAVSVQLEDERLLKIKEVLKELPRPHYQTLVYLMRHLVKMATYSAQTNMHARNLAIVWAPNLLRSKDIEASGFNGTAAFMEVRVQSIVVEFILTHVTQLFPEPNSGSGYTSERRKSLPSPSIQSGHDDSFFKSSPIQCPGNLSPGDGPPPIRPYHAIIDGTDKRKGSLKGRKWKSIFNLGGRLQDPRKKNKYAVKDKEKTSLRPAKSMDSLSSGPYVPEDSQNPSTNLAPAPMSSGNTEGMAPGTGGVASGYAVTYRRTGGASVSVVSGGSGAHGTYKSLDPGGPASSEKPQTTSQISASRAERRAGMHISGPFSVTVPLHITSGLALGVLQGGRPEEEQLTSQAPEEQESMNESMCKESLEEKEPEVKRESGQTDMETEGLGDRDKEKMDSMCGKEEKDIKSEEIEETGPQEREESEEEDLEFVSEDEEPDNRPHADRPLLNEDQDGGDYMVMRPTMLSCPVEDKNKEISPMSNEETNPDQELPLDFQDTFGFLDLMDTYSSNQVNEFSVEPPAFEDEQEEEDKQSPQSKCHPAQLLVSRCDMRDLPTNLHRLATGKSHSLPYKACHLQPVLSSDDDDDIDYSGLDGECDSMSDKSEYEDMFYKSLPSESQFHGLNWTCPPTTLSHDQSEGSNLIPNIEVQEDIPDLPSGNQVEIPETQIHTEIIVKDDVDACITEQILNEANITSLPLEIEYSPSTENLGEKVDKGNEDKSTKVKAEFKSFDAGLVNAPTEEETEGFWRIASKENAVTCSNNETPSMECENHVDSCFDPSISSISVEPNTMGMSWMGEQPSLKEEHARSDAQQEITEGSTVSESEDKLISEVDCVLWVTEDNVETSLERQTEISELGGVLSGLGEEERNETNMVEEMWSEVEMDDKALPEDAEADVEELDVDVQKDETELDRREEDRTIEMQNEGSNTGKENYKEIEEDDIMEETEVKTDLEDASEIKEGSVLQEAKEEEMSEEDRISENEQQDGTEVHPDERQSESGNVDEDKYDEMSETEEPLSLPTIKDIGPGMGRTVVVSKNTPLKVYQVKSVPVVPPKPQHSKITAFKQQFHQRDIEKQFISIPHFERVIAKKEKETEHQEQSNIEGGDIGRNDHQNTEQEEETQENEAVHVKKQQKEAKPCHSFGGENKEDSRQRRGTWDGVCRRKDIQKDLDREAKRTSGISICFDEAVARASGKLCREKETTEKDRIVDIHWERGEHKEGLNESKMEKEVKTD